METHAMPVIDASPAIEEIIIEKYYISLLRLVVTTYNRLYLNKLSRMAYSGLDGSVWPEHTQIDG